MSEPINDPAAVLDDLRDVPPIDAPVEVEILDVDVEPGASTADVFGDVLGI